MSAESWAAAVRARREARTEDPLGAAIATHEAALAAQAAMRTVAHERDAAVRAARAAGISVAELATALGVNRHRIHAMLKREGVVNEHQR